jgi:hypothetical protein
LKKAVALITIVTLLGFSSCGKDNKMTPIMRDSICASQDTNCIPKDNLSAWQSIKGFAKEYPYVAGWTIAAAATVVIVAAVEAGTIVKLACDKKKLQERLETIHVYNPAPPEITRLKADVDRLEKEKNSALIERDGANQERDDLRIVIDQRDTEINGLKAERDELFRQNNFLALENFDLERDLRVERGKK